MTIRVRLTSLLSSGGDFVELPTSGVTCIVGGNNVGKSQALREILSHLTSTNAVALTIVKAEADKPPITVEDARTFLSEVAIPVSHKPGAEPIYSPLAGGTQLTAPDFHAHYQAPSPALQAAHGFFVWHASAGSLVNFASDGIGNVGIAGLSHPLSRIFRDGDLEQQLSELAEDSFGSPLTLDRINGDVRLRVGRVDVEVPPLDHPTFEYAEAVRLLPTLEAQGDGIRSFLGFALAVVAGTSQILLVDEPEAFLHPGQARSLGRWVSTEAAKRDLQVVVATHDRDFLLGLIGGAEESVVNIVRLTRHADTNHFLQLPPEEVAAVWRDPVLRYSNVLQGLFHDRVVICEADADCRFFGAVLDQLAIDEGRRAAADNVLLVPSGGKQRVSAMAAALTRLGVETHAILDFDVLNNRAEVIKIVEAVGGTWSAEMNARYVTFSQILNQKGLWDQVKNQGINGVPAGSAFAACQELLEDLGTCRVHVVRCGEMEDFDKTIGLHGAGWVSEMLQRNGHADSEDARRLVATFL